MDNFLNWNFLEWVPSESDELFIETQPDRYDGWYNCDAEIRCIWADQRMTKPETLTGKLYLHRFGWYHGLMIYQASDGSDAEAIYNQILSH